jgi:hypothetical protein
MFTIFQALSYKKLTFVLVFASIIHEGGYNDKISSLMFIHFSWYNVLDCWIIWDSLLCSFFAYAKQVTYASLSF